MLLEQLTLIELKPYQGRHREYVESTQSIFKNSYATVTEELFEIAECSLQPIDGRTLQALPEGYRSKAAYQFWCKTEMKGLEQNTSQLPDQIQINGEWFSVYNFKDWIRTSYLSHYHCAAIREEINNSMDSSNNTGGNYG